jgi:4-hydroxybenzoate polyprenyltransferase
MVLRATTTPGTRAWAVVRLTRPWFWPLSCGGAYVGAVLATHTWLPPHPTAALLVLGPLVWGAVLALNDRYDLPSDRHNPRKATAPLVTGVLSTQDTAWCGAGFSAAALLVAWTIGPIFTAGTAAVLLLGWLYSVPPIRLKARPGADVAVNALVVGVLAPAAGWCLYRPVGDFPPVMVALGLLVAAALYLPTTVMDVDADRIAGDATAAVRWRPTTCYAVGVGLWSCAVALWLVCCRLELLVPGQDSAVQPVMAPILVGAYAVATRRPTIARLAAVSLTFAVPAADFLAACVAA